MRNRIIMCKKIFTIFVFIGIVFSQSPDELYNAANISLEAGNVSEAEAGFNAALQADPTFAPGYMGLARVSVRKGDLSKAKDYYLEAIEADPSPDTDYRNEYEQLTELNTLMSKGRRSLQNGEIDDAFVSFRIAYEKFPHYPESVFNMGLGQMRNKEYMEAVNNFHKTMAINPEHKNALAAIKNVAKNFFNSANQSYKRSDLESALSSYERVLEVDKTFYQAYHQIGMIKSKMGDKDESIQFFEKALAVNPQFYKGYYALGLAKTGLNDDEGAIAALQSAVDIHPGYDKAYGAMSDIYIRLNNYEKAKQVLNMSITVNPNYAKGYANMGMIFIEEQDWKQAISNLVMATTLNDRDVKSFIELARTYNATENCSEAKKAARKSTELKNRSGGGWFELGVAEWCNGKGNKTGALNAFEKARNDRAWRKMAEHEMDKIKNPQKYEN